MLKQHTRARVERQRNIACDHRGLRRRHRALYAELFRGLRAVIDARRGHERGFFLVEREDNVPFRRLEHRPAAQRGARQVDAVVGQAGRTGREKRVEIGHFLAFQTLGDRTGL